MAKLAVAITAMALALAPEIAAAQAVGAPPIPNAPIPMTRPMPPMPAPPPVPMVPVPSPAMMPAMPMHHGAPPMPPAPGVYVAPSYGFTLPGYWQAPQYFIGNYWSFGLPGPAPGFGWSRYHNDYVLTDRWGRVYDWRDARDYRDGRWRDGRRNRDRSGIVGALLGAAVGALSGNLIAGAGDRLAGSLIGGGLGALAGQAIDKSTQRDRGYSDGYGYRYRERGPHWGGGYAESCNCGGETVTTVTTTYPEKVTERKVRYVTEYVRVPARAQYVRRGKYVPLK